MINKRTFKVKDIKQVLHKIGKKWVVMSAVLLGLVAGGVAVTSTQHVAMFSLMVEAHADSATVNNVPVTDATGDFNQGPAADSGAFTEYPYSSEIPNMPVEDVPGNFNPVSQSGLKDSVVFWTGANSQTFYRGEVIPDDDWMIKDSPMTTTSVKNFVNNGYFYDLVLKASGDVTMNGDHQAPVSQLGDFTLYAREYPFSSEIPKVAIKDGANNSDPIGSSGLTDDVVFWTGANSQTFTAGSVIPNDAWELRSPGGTVTFNKQLTNNGHTYDLTLKTSGDVTMNGDHQAPVSDLGNFTLYATEEGTPNDNNNFSFISDNNNVAPSPSVPVNSNNNESANKFTEPVTKPAKTHKVARSSRSSKSYKYVPNYYITKLAKRAKVLSAYYKGRQVTYPVKVGKLIAKVYGKARKPALIYKNGLRAYFKSGRKAYRLSYRNFKKVRVLSVVRKGDKLIFNVLYNRQHGFISENVTKKIYVHPKKTFRKMNKKAVRKHAKKHYRKHNRTYFRRHKAGYYYKGSRINKKQVLKHRRYRNNYRKARQSSRKYRRTKAYRKVRKYRKHTVVRKRRARHHVTAKPRPYQHVNMTEMADREGYDINQDREENGVAPLSISNQLAQIAAERAKQAESDYGHYDSANNAYYADEDAQQMGYSHDQNGVDDWTNGENLNEAYPGGTADQIADEMNHSFMYDDAASNWGHRNNILNPDFQYEGVGTYYDPNSSNGVPYKLAEDFSNTPYY